MRRLRQAAGALAALALWSGQPLAQDDLAASVAKLTGGGSREWILTNIITQMGTTPTCSQGESYRFASNKKVTVTRCENGQLKTAVYDWAVEQPSPIDVAVTFNNQRYYVRFLDIDKAHLMRLEIRSDSRTLPSKDLELRLSDD